MDLYFTMKEGGLKDFTPTVFLFGAKSAPGYYRAKGIIKYINCIAELVNNDPDVKDRLAVKFVSNYRVSVSYTHLDVYKRQCRSSGILQVTPFVSTPIAPFFVLSLSGNTSILQPAG